MLICPCETTTTYRDSYRKFPKDNVAEKADQILRSSEVTSSEEKEENRDRGDGSPERKKNNIPPRPKFGAKEYKEYLSRLECFKKEIIKIYFRCPDIDVCHLDRMIEKLERDVYQVIFYPKLYQAPPKERRPWCKYPWDSGNRDLFGATYRGLYYRVQELFRFRDILYNMARISDKMQQKLNLKKLSKTGTSTYYDDICSPAIQSAKEKKLKTSPIDRHTLRRV